ncbi:T9SS type A sorting domain-containing protein [bacterium]|nr:T9SS type A sorting domain-containing protein [bacterium]
MLFSGSDALLHYTIGASATFLDVELPFPIDVMDAYLCLPVQFKDNIFQFTVERYNQFDNEKMFSVYTSFDQGQTWHTPGETYEMEGDLFTHAITVNDRDYLVAGKHVGESMIVSDDYGATWTTRTVNPPIQRLEVIDDVLYSREYYTNAVTRSVDVGVTWESIPLPVPNVETTWIRPLVLNDTLYAHFNDILYAKPEGEDWIERSEMPFQWGAPDANWDIVTSAEVDTFMVMGVQGERVLWVSYDMGTTWQDNPLEMPWANQGSSAYSIVYDKYRDRLWVDTFGGLAYLDFTEQSVHDPWVLQPATFVTLDAYPNPFNASTTVRYSLNTPQPVKLDVFDVLGRHVATLAEGLRAPGSHEAVFDAATLASGTYYLQLSTAEQTQNRKLVLVK